MEGEGGGERAREWRGREVGRERKVPHESSPLNNEGMFLGKNVYLCVLATCRLIILYIPTILISEEGTFHTHKTLENKLHKPTTLLS